MKKIWFVFLSVIIVMHSFQCGPTEPPTPGNECTACPVVSNVTPNTGFEGDTVLLTGKNLGNAERVLFDNKLEAQILENSGATGIKVKVPVIDQNTPDTVKINVHKRGPNNQLLTTNVQGTFIYKMTTVQAFVPSTAYEGDTVEVRGQKLEQLDKLFFDDVEIKISIRENRYLFVLPPSLRVNTAAVGVRGLQKNNRNVLIGASAQFFYSYPRITQLMPPEAFEGDTVQLQGNRLDLLENIKVGGQTILIIKNAAMPHTYKFRVPGGGGEPITLMDIQGLGKNSVVFPDIIKFSWLKEHIRDFIPKQGGRGQIVTIYGKFKTKSTSIQVHHGDYPYAISAPNFNRDSIKVRVDSCSKHGLLVLNKGKPDESISREKLFYVPSVVKKQVILPALTGYSNYKITASLTDLYLAYNDGPTILLLKTKLPEHNCKINSILPPKQIWFKSPTGFRVGTEWSLINISAYKNFAYILYDGIEEKSPFPIYLGVNIDRINSGNMGEKFVENINGGTNLETDQDENIYSGPNNGKMFKYGNSNLTFDVKSIFVGYSDQAGIAMSADKIVYVATDKIYSVNHSFTDQRLEFDNPKKYTISHLAVNKFKKLELIVFQDKGDQKVIVYNTVNKLVTEYQNQQEDYADICLDANDFIYVVSKNGLFRLEEQ